MFVHYSYRTGNLPDKQFDVLSVDKGMESIRNRPEPDSSADGNSGDSTENHIGMKNRTQNTMKKLSVLIPAYNEEKTIVTLLEKVAKASPKGLVKEVIVINDCSRDSTEELVLDYQARNPENLSVYFRQPENLGKGAAIRKGLEFVTGDYVIVQDADLEYDPEDYGMMFDTLKRENLKVIYGSRFLKPQNRHSYQRYYFGGRLVTMVANILFRQQLTDEPTCYKFFDTEFLKSIPLKCTGFEFCPEVTAKVAKRGVRIREVPISYYPRLIEEGKKIKWTDGIEAIWTLLKYRFMK
jgi:glycosyltransferase involved in cell wall biosynthesis